VPKVEQLRIFAEDHNLVQKTDVTFFKGTAPERDDEEMSRLTEMAALDSGRATATVTVCSGE
jgi:hypothetical protein